MKKIVCLLMALLMAATLCACGSGSSDAGAGDASAEDNGKFIMGIDPEYPPFSYMGDDGVLRYLDEGEKYQDELNEYKMVQYNAIKDKKNRVEEFFYLQ